MVAPNALEARQCGAGAGVRWFTSAWRIFTNAWLEMIIATVIVFAIALAVGMVPIVSVAQSLIYPVFMAGFFYMAHQSDQDNNVSIGDLFVVFQEQHRSKLIKLLLVGVASLVASFAVFILFAVIAAVGFFLFAGVDGLQDVQQTWAQLGESGFNAAFAIGLAVFVLLFVLSMILISCAFWLATPLIWFADCDVLAAIKLSIQAALRNIGALIMLSLVLIVAGIIALIPLGLGLFILIPVVWITFYTAYKDIFDADLAVFESTL